MKYDLADWMPARDKLIVRIEAGAWRHGIKTKAAVGEVVRYGAFPADPSTMWAVKWKKKNGDLIDYALYYFVQSGLKHRRWVIVGKSGRKLRPRRIYCVENGVAEGELDENGRAVRPEKEGLWLRSEDLTRLDVEKIRGTYRDRETDSSSDKEFLRIASRVLSGKSAETLVGDVLDEIAAAM